MDITYLYDHHSFSYVLLRYLQFNEVRVKASSQRLLAKKVVHAFFKKNKATCSIIIIFLELIHASIVYPSCTYECKQYTTCT